jgi:hypothetical protein
MTSPDKPRAKDHHFNSFAMGVAVGVGAALLFGTEEGKKLAGNLFDMLPEKIKSLTDNTEDPSQYRHSGLDPESIPSTLLQEPEATPHSYTYNEPPPPPAPHVVPTPPSLR